MTDNVLLEMRGISKEFSGVRALNLVSFNVKQGEIHALCGENGAGKSTLMKILAGFYPHRSYSGDVLINGKTQEYKGIRDSEKAGIAIIHQELSLIPEMTIGENIFIGREPSSLGFIDWNTLYTKTKKLLDSIGLKINPLTPVKHLGIGQQQLVEIAKALSHNPSILVLDEPTSALAKDEIEILLKLLKDLKNRGVTCVLISHKLNEVLDVSDRITILRDGRAVKTLELSEATQDIIISHMVGRELKDFYPRLTRKIGDVLFEARNFTVANTNMPGKYILNNASFVVKRGEILGISGLMGAGRTEFLQTIFGVKLGKTQGEVYLNGELLKISSPHDAIKAGLSLLPEDRKRHGLVLEDTVAKNMSLAGLNKISQLGIVNFQAERIYALKQLKDLHIKASSIQAPVKSLSGGNQQKVVIAKCLMTTPKVLFLDEPTRGIDVGAKAEIYQLMNELAAQGLAIVMVSSELPEILGVSDRIIVMSEGRISGEFLCADATQEKIMAQATVRM
ncbi:MAG: xylose ABC transporter ATP-binding protein [Oligoflexia bacterium]|nr:xylose ABC transporter ATP-binding protein [Oligoflexia bacterium]